MDRSKSAASRKGRVARPLELEPLEGRRLMTAAAGKVAVSEGLASGVPTLLITGTNRADVIDINDNGTGAAGGITVSLEDGTTYTTRNAIAQIELNAGGGNDQVTYTLSGNLTSPRTVLVSLGSGNDNFTANLDGAIDNPSGLDLEVYGDSGNDTITDNQNGPVLQGTLIPFIDGGPGNDVLTYNGSGAVSAGATLNPAISGDAGNDTITSDYTGTLHGNMVYNLTINGGAGNDTINDIMNLAPGSTGQIGSSSTTPALIEGGPGNDKIQYAILGDPAVTQTQVNAKVIGGPGRDIVKRTANVVSDPTNETDMVAS